MSRLFDPLVFDPLVFDTSVRITPIVRVPATLASTLRSQHKPISRLLFLNPDMSVLHEVPFRLLDGSVTMDRTQDTHRSATVGLLNEGGVYDIVDNTSLVWPGRLVRIERGAIVGPSAQYVSLITGVLDNPSDALNSGRITFTVWSRLHLADQQFVGPITFAGGTLIQVVVRTIAALAGLGSSDDLYEMADGGQALTEARTFGIADNMLASMVKLATDAGCELFDDGAGVLIMRPTPDPSTVAPIWDFTPGDDSVLVSRTRSIKAQTGIYNRFVVIGTDPSRYPIRAEWKVTNPLDPLYWTPDFDRPAPPYISADVTTQQMANAVAQQKGIQAAMGSEASTASTIPVPLLLETGRPVVTYSGIAQLLDRVDCPVGPGAMTLTSTRVRSLVAA